MDNDYGYTVKQLDQELRDIKKLYPSNPLTKREYRFYVEQFMYARARSGR